MDDYSRIEIDKKTESVRPAEPVQAGDGPAGLREGAIWDVFEDSADEAAIRHKVWNFGKLALPCLIYTVIFVFCLYRNFGTVTTPVWVLSVLSLVVYMQKSTGKKLKKSSYCLGVVMLVISVSCFCTANPFTLFMNYAAEFLLIVTLLLNEFADTSGWDIGKLLKEVFAAPFMAFAMIYTPFTDGAAFWGRRDKGKAGYGGRILLGVLASVPVLFILGLLLTSADAVFENMFINFFNAINLNNVVRVVLMLVFGFFSAYCGIRYMGAGVFAKKTAHDGCDDVVPATVLTLVSVMYLAFSAVQIIYLFVGGFTLPEGMTYAMYARRGFFQLLLVCILNLIAVLLVKKYVKRTGILNALLILICGCTYIMLASSAIRMVMYIRAYNLTYDRIAVLATLLTLAVLLAGVMAFVIFDRFPFMRFTVAVVCVLYSVFSFVNVDSAIVSYNLHNKAAEGGQQDLRYISRLSADAAPAILEYIEEKRAEGVELANEDWFLEYKDRNQIGNGALNVRKFNISKQRAKAVLLRV